MKQDWLTTASTNVGHGRWVLLNLIKNTVGIQKPGHAKTELFEIRNGAHLSGFQMVGLTDFRSRSKFTPFATQPLFDHLKFRLVWISDPQCILIQITCVVFT